MGDHMYTACEPGLCLMYDALAFGVVAKMMTVLFYCAALCACAGWHELAGRYTWVE
jgi:hypothetical protein